MKDEIALFQNTTCLTYLFSDRPCFSEQTALIHRCSSATVLEMNVDILVIDSLQNFIFLQIVF